MALALCLFSPVVAFSQPIAGNYGLGAGLGQTSAIMAPQGTRLVENGYITYNIDKFVDEDGNDGGAPSTTVHAARLTFRNVFQEVQIFGADYSVGLVLTYRDQVLRPAPGAETSYQLGDTVITPIALGWHMGEWHTQVSYMVWAPTGKFESGGTQNTGKGLWSHMLFAGATWRQEAALPFSATFQARYETFGKQETTNIRPGDVLSLEFAAGKQINEEWALGVLAATSFQVSGQSNTPGGNPSKYRINLVGLEAVWRPKALRGAQVALRLGKEFENRNTTQGHSALLSLAYAF